MPITIRKSKTAPEEPQPRSALLAFDEDDALTLAGEVAVDFLETVDWSGVFRHEDVEEHVHDASNYPEGFFAEDDEEGEPDEDAPEVEYDFQVALDGLVVEHMVDMGDLVDMFEHYIGQRTDVLYTQEGEESSLSERAQMALFDKLVEDGEFTEEGKLAAQDLLSAVLGESVVVDDQVNEKFFTKSERKKIARVRKKPKSGAQKKVLKKRRLETRKKRTKVRLMATRSKRKRRSRETFLKREKRNESAEIFDPLADEALIVLGYGDGVDEADYVVSTLDDFEIPADVVERKFTKADGENSKLGKKLKKKHGKGEDDEDDDDKADEGSYLKGTKKKKGKKYGDDDDEEKDETVGESLSYQQRTSLPFALPPTLAEGANIAAAAIGQRQPKTLNEDSK